MLIGYQKAVTQSPRRFTIAAVDGKSIVDFFAALADSDNKGTPAVPLNMAKLHRSPAPGLVDMGVRAAWHTVRSPIGMVDALMRSTPALYNFAQNALTSSQKSEEGSGTRDTLQWAGFAAEGV